jgi:hypothetical protein
MKHTVVVVIMLGVMLGAHLANAQTYIGISGTIPATTVSANVATFCKDKVVITADPDKMEYMLTANFTGWNWGEGACGMYGCNATSKYPDAGAALTLLNGKGNVVYAKETRAIHNAFKDMCKDYFGKARKHAAEVQHSTSPSAPAPQAVPIPNCIAYDSLGDCVKWRRSEVTTPTPPALTEQTPPKDEPLTSQTKVAYMVRRNGGFWIEDDKSLRNDTAADIVFADTTCRVIPSTMSRWDYFTLCFGPQWKDPRFSGMCQKDANGDGCLIGWQKSSTSNTTIPVHN